MGHIKVSAPGQVTTMKREGLFKPTSHPTVEISVQYRSPKLFLSLIQALLITALPEVSINQLPVGASPWSVSQWSVPSLWLIGSILGHLKS